VVGNAPQKTDSHPAAQAQIALVVSTRLKIISGVEYGTRERQGAHPRTLPEWRPGRIKIHSGKTLTTLLPS
jgi:hypothetical protein